MILQHALPEVIFMFCSVVNLPGNEVEASPLALVHGSLLASANVSEAELPSCIVEANVSGSTSQIKLHFIYLTVKIFIFDKTNRI